MTSEKKTSNGDLQVAKPAQGLLLVWRVLFVIVCLAIWVVGFVVGGWKSQQAPTDLLYEEREHLLAKIVEYRNRIGDLDIERAQQQVALDIAEASSEKVRQEYRLLYKQLDGLQEKLTHYERVLKPNAGEQGIVMGLLEITALDGQSQYQYSIDFFQAVERRKLAGQVQLSLNGELNGQPQTWDFQSLIVQEPLNLKLGFMHYQTLTGVIKLPKGAVPLAVVVSAQISQGKSVRLAKVFDWVVKVGDDRSQKEKL